MSRCLLFQGSNLLTGCTAEDVKVWIGNSTCKMIDVTQNIIQCEPPIEQPGQHSDFEFITGAVQVVVSRIIKYL